MIRHAQELLNIASTARTVTFPRLIRLGFFTIRAAPKALACFAAVFVGIIPTDLSIATVLLIVAVVFVVEVLWYVVLNRLCGSAITALGVRIAYN